MEMAIPALDFSIGCTNIRRVSYEKRTQKAGYWDAVLVAAERRITELFLLIGDFNTGKHRIDETGRTFHCADMFGQLEESGWTDAWPHFNRMLTESTWYGRIKGGRGVMA